MLLSRSIIVITLIMMMMIFYHHHHHHHHSIFLSFLQPINLQFNFALYNMVNNSQTGSTPTTHDPLGRSRSEIGLEVALAILICLISFLDNFLVVYVVHKDSRLKSLTNVFVQNLALTEISMATLHMPFQVINLYTRTWIFSERWCEIQAVINCILSQELPLS